MVYEDVLSSIAVYGIIAGIAVFVIKNKFPTYWSILFPSEDEKMTHKLGDLDRINEALTQKKQNLEEYKTKLQANQNITKQIKTLVDEIKEIEGKKK